MNLKTRIKEWNIARKQRRERGRDGDLDQLVVMGIGKNESLNIDEWIEHYLWQGADRVVFINNESTDDTADKARAWAKRGAPVTVLDMPGRHMQTRHYQTAFRKLGLDRAYRWLLIADLDEFLFCPNGDRVADALSDYDGVRLIYLNWVHFGTSGYDKHPKSLRRCLLERRPGLGSHVNTKWIARTWALRGGKSIGVHKVGKVSSRAVISDNQRFQLNHYQTQSREFFFGVKAKRGSALSSKNDTARTAEYFKRSDEGCTVRDTKLADLLDR